MVMYFKQEDTKHVVHVTELNKTGHAVALVAFLENIEETGISPNRAEETSEKMATRMLSVDRFIERTQD